MDTAVPHRTLHQGEMLNWYRIDRILGRGGFGVIYLAHDTYLAQDVAIKEYVAGDLSRTDDDHGASSLVDQSVATREKGLERFISEARNHVRFKHPNIVRVMSVFQKNDTAYMVMEFEEGINLREHLKCVPDARSEAALRSLLVPIAEGLAEVHRHGFIHRDIKPSNILVRPDGSPVLLDFGSARNAGELTRQGLTALVSAGYAPLEQYDDDGGIDGQQGPWTDIYALGGVLYHAISSGDPVDSTRRASAVFNGGRDPLLPAAIVGKGSYDDRFLSAIDWALSFRIADRPQSLDDWLPVLLAGDDPAQVAPRLAQGVASAAEAPTVLSERSVADGITRRATASTPAIGKLSGGSRWAMAFVVLTLVAGSVWLASDDEQAALLGRLVADAEIPGVDDTAVAAGAKGAAEGAEAARQAEQAQAEMDRQAAVLAQAERAETEQVKAAQAEAERADAELAAARLAEGERTERERLARQDVARQAAAKVARDRAESEARRVAVERRLAEDERKAAARAAADKARRLAEVQAQVDEEKARAALKLADVRATDAEVTAEASRLNRAQVARAAADVAAAEAARLENAKREADALVVKQAAARQRADERAAIARRAQAAEAARRATEAAVPVDDGDIAIVMQRFEALRLAIIRHDAMTMNSATEPSSQNRLFEQLMDDFADLDVTIQDIQVRNTDKSITATLRIQSMVRENGDRAIPSDAYRDRQIISRRLDGEWSAITW